MATLELTYGDPTISVVGEGFCVPFPLELTVKMKTKGLFGSRFEVLDVNGNLFLQVDGTYLGFRYKRVIRDPAGSPILTLREKVLTVHHCWTAHRGESSDRQNLLFNVQQPRLFQLKTRLGVFFPGNVTEEFSDFQVVGCNYMNSSLSFRVYKGDALIAEVDHKYTWGSIFKGKESFRVKINPGVDYAFIVALIVIVNENEAS